VLADSEPIGYSKGKIRLKTKLVLVRISNILNTQKISIIDLRGTNIFIRYN
jgi:hypothetical protein